MSGTQTQSVTRSFTGTLERERIHFNKIAQRKALGDLVMPRSNIVRYHNPPEGTPFPLEYAFHLLGDLRGKTVVDLGCGDGLDTVILASLGATVMAVDISDKSLELTRLRARVNGVESQVKLVHSDAAAIPIDDGTADRVLCAAILHHVDCITAAQQIRRILKPGGLAVFSEPVVDSSWLKFLKKFLPKQADVTEDERPLTMDQVNGVSQTIGCEGRRRGFFLFSTRLVWRVSLQAPRIIRASHRLDAWISRHISGAHSLASPIVWEAHRQF